MNEATRAFHSNGPYIRRFNRRIASLSDWRQKEYLADTRYLDRCLHAYRRFFRHWSMVRKARGV